MDRRAMTQEHEEQTTLNAEAARGGKELGVVRNVLRISLALAVLAGIVVFLIIRH
jgi:hypothetical protein